MDATRTNLPIHARLLLPLVLLVTLACGFGHGQMLRVMFTPPAPPQAHTHAHGHDMAHMQHMSMHHAEKTTHAHQMPGMNSPYGDCYFAGSLPLVVVLFALLGWLLRHRSYPPASPRTVFALPLRHLLPQLNPRAP